MKRKFTYCAFFALLIFAGSCNTTEIISPNPDDENITDSLPDTDSLPNTDNENLYSDWTDETHSKKADPNYSVVFPDEVKLLRLDLAISAENWQVMQDDLADNLGGSFGGGGGLPGGGGGFPGGGGHPDGGGMTSTEDYDPVWVPCNVEFEGKNWYEVGVRYKGNSSLSSAYQSGNEKLSLKFDFDQFEDDYPELKNQRFYGFKQLNVNNGYNDASLMRDKVALDLFREFGVASSHATFCQVYIDRGNGSEYFGVYTIIEEVDDTVIETQFTDDNGNLYKPENSPATFAKGSYSEEDFAKKTNEDEADYSDVRALYDLLHSDIRTSDTEAWKDELEAIFDIDQYLKYLAVNMVIQNWDTYGNMSHNYFLYNNPDNNLLTWIPWDNNESLQDGHGRNALSFTSIYNVSSEWPLISYIIAIEEYEEIFKGYVRDFTDNVFSYSNMSAKYDQYYNLLKEAAYAEENGRTFISSDAAFDSAISTLKSHCTSRKNAVDSYLK